MSHDRNFKWLNQHRIITSRDPINDKPDLETPMYKFFANGTYECYQLFKSKAKITTYRSLKWHLLVIYYLNKEYISEDLFKHVAKFIANKENGFTTFFIKESLLDKMINEVINQGGDPPVNKVRKVIFNYGTGLDISEKLSIVGKLIGRSRITEDLIYNSMLEINHEGEKITLDKLAKHLNCTVRTLHRNMSNQLKQEKERLNEEV